MQETISYKNAGVDIEKGDLFVERIKAKVQSRYGHRVKHGVGGFCCLYEITEEKLLAAGTDGVGTKLKLAIELNKHNTIGIDLVAMCVNDIICSGADPLFFMDYLASSNLDLDISEQIIEGVIQGCELSAMPLIGGETAEMPGMYGNGDYDLAGFCVGEVLKEKVLDGKNVHSGHSLVGISSSGFHSNGYSLLRKLIENESKELKEKLLTPTRIYTKLVSDLKKQKIKISGISHITGGGIDNIKRMNPSLSYDLSNLPDVCSDEFKQNVCDSFEYIKELSKLNEKELYKTFNMGIGLVIATDQPDEVIELAQSHFYPAWNIGTVF